MPSLCIERLPERVKTSTHQISRSKSNLGYYYALKRNRAYQNNVDGRVERFKDDADLCKEVGDSYSGDNRFFELFLKKD